MNWIVKQTEELSGSVSRYRIHDDHGALSVGQVIELWINNEAFRSLYISLLQDSTHPSYYWEHPPMASDLLDMTYEFVLVRSDVLHTVSVTPQFFDNYYREKGEVVVFPNLGGDAMLIVPSPIGIVTHYTHLAQFARMGGGAQVHSLLSIIGKTLRSNLNSRRTWLNTSGLGVYYVHVRLDTRPKYYTFLPYKNISFFE